MTPSLAFGAGGLLVERLVADQVLEVRRPAEPAEARDLSDFEL